MASAADASEKICIFFRFSSNSDLHSAFSKLRKKDRLFLQFRLDFAFLHVAGNGLIFSLFNLHSARSSPSFFPHISAQQLLIFK
jgi:hypothetical protein